jgi:hypothetical protein
VSVLTTSRESLAPAMTSSEKRHQFLLSVFIWVAIAMTLSLAIYGYGYYTLDQAHRVISPKHAYLKPSGVIGINLGIFGVVLFLLIYLYAIRKHWRWLGRLGNSRHWLNFHVVLGVTAPVIITFHSSFKFHGIAGVAYWIMVAVALSGFVGRYLYSLIPRSLGAAEISLKEMKELSDQLAQQLHAQQVVSTVDLASLFSMPDARAVQSMSGLRVLALGIWLDLTQPWRIRKIRRKAMRARVKGKGPGIRPFESNELENVFASVKRQTQLSRKILFLSKTQEMFQLWHIVHQPFSYSFALLALIHIGVALLFGYF